jgi:hypothetical protein
MALRSGGFDEGDEAPTPKHKARRADRDNAPLLGRARLPSDALTRLQSVNGPDVFDVVINHLLSLDGALTQ